MHQNFITKKKKKKKKKKKNKKKKKKTIKIKNFLQIFFFYSTTDF